MILKKEPYKYKSGKGPITQTGYKWTFQCDNPDCKKVFNRAGTKSRHERANHYCCHPCSTSVVRGICKLEDCDQPIRGNGNVRKLDSGLCRKHHKKLGRKLRVARQRKEIFKMMGNQCANCGEKDSIFFQIDHIENDADYSGDGNNAPSIELRHYLQEPDRYQLLCANCNHAKRMNGGELYFPKHFTRRQPMGKG